MFFSRVEVTVRTVFARRRSVGKRPQSPARCDCLQRTLSITAMGWLSLHQVLDKQIAKTILALGISLFFVKPESDIFLSSLKKSCEGLIHGWKVL